MIHNTVCSLLRHTSYDVSLEQSSSNSWEQLNKLFVNFFFEAD